MYFVHSTASRKLPVEPTLETARAAGAGTWLLRRRAQNGGSGAAAAGARRPAGGVVPRCSDFFSIYTPLRADYRMKLLP